MSDLIDREAALDCFNDWIDRHGDVHAADEDTVYQKIEALPSEPQWIPCSERLPEENLPVLVAVKQKDRLPKWIKEQTYSYVTDIDVYDDGDFDTHKNKVVAWMPLPEPYKGEEDG